MRCDGNGDGVWVVGLLGGRIGCSASQCYVEDVEGIGGFFDVVVGFF